jgi:ergothioneine biosynthesis protein EgtB
MVIQDALRTAEPKPGPDQDLATSKNGATFERNDLLARYAGVRQFSEALCETLVPEDYVIQTMPEMSPTKWHLAHTSWFFETFVLKPHLPGYKPLHPAYAFLFNSYYNAAGKMHARPQRGLISRPTVSETFAYRNHVDALVRQLLETAEPEALERLAPLITLGLNHEQQHQELIQTDIKHVFWMNPLRPVFREQKAVQHCDAGPAEWRHYPESVYYIGHHGKGFCFDNETPRHGVFLQEFALASRLVTNREYLGFIEEDGYKRPEFWLSLGWNTVKERGWDAPLYWEKQKSEWWSMTLGGMRKIVLDEPVCHVSYFEADAFARWANARLPEEAEWEMASFSVPVDGHFAESGRFHPMPLFRHGLSERLSQMFGDVWQWTQSSYSPYPGYKTAAGALGEYNGKFMCNQYVLRGASCATPRSHARRTYRNFFPPEARWQFTGIRLARGPE